MEMRIGHGYDAHRFAPGRKLILAGVEIAHAVGLDGYSDADVLAHAVTDAVLGALALGDIGGMFPDSDPTYKDANSMMLLMQLWAEVQGMGWRLGNLDVTAVAQAPKLAPYLGQMRENLAQVLGAQVGQINVKATTEERMGFTGSGEGMCAHAVCLLVQG